MPKINIQHSIESVTKLTCNVYIDILIRRCRSGNCGERRGSECMRMLPSPLQKEVVGTGGRENSYCGVGDASVSHPGVVPCGGRLEHSKSGGLQRMCSKTPVHCRKENPHKQPLRTGRSPANVCSPGVDVKPPSGRGQMSSFSLLVSSKYPKNSQFSQHLQEKCNKRKKMSNSLSGPEGVLFYNHLHWRTANHLSTSPTLMCSLHALWFPALHTDAVYI